MKNILIPTDFSSLSAKAFEVAKDLFSGEQLALHLLSIVPVTADVLFDNKGELLEDGIIDFKHLLAEKAEKERLMKEWSEGKSEVVSSKVKIGRITDDIIQYAANNSIDLIVMGTEGASGFKELIMGSHTSYIAMRSPVPVMSIKDKSDVNGLDKILLVGDFKNPQIIDLSIMKSILKDNEAVIQLLKVNTPGDFETNEEILSRMKEFAEMNELKNAEYHVYCDHSVEKGMASFSEENNVNLIAIGSQQRTGLSRIVRRSISYEAINHLRQAIISFPVR